MISVSEIDGDLVLQMETVLRDGTHGRVSIVARLLLHGGVDARFCGVTDADFAALREKAAQLVAAETSNSP